jgi:transcription elongation factor Elf1
MAMDVTKNSVSINCPHCNNKSTYAVSVQQLVDGQRLTCTSCGKEIVIDKELFKNVERIIDNLPVGGFPAGKINAVKSSLSITCPACGGVSKYEIGLHELTDGRKVVCEHCGKGISVDGEKLRRVEQVLEKLGVPEESGGGRTIDVDGVPVQMKTKTVSFNVSKTFNVNIGAKDNIRPDMEEGPGYKPIGPSQGLKGGGCRSILIVAIFLLSCVLFRFVM